MIEVINSWLLAVAMWLGLTDEVQRGQAVRAVFIGLGVSLLLTQLIKSHPRIKSKKGEAQTRYDWNIRLIAFVLGAPLTAAIWPGAWETEWAAKTGFGLLIGMGASPLHKYILRPLFKRTPWGRAQAGRNSGG